MLDTAREQKQPPLTAIEALLAAEVDAVEARRLAARLRFACLPAPWTLADFDYAAQPGVDEHLIRELATLRFVDDGANVVFIGPNWSRGLAAGGGVLVMAVRDAAADAQQLDDRATSRRDHADMQTAESDPEPATAGNGRARLHLVVVAVLLERLTPADFGSGRFLLRSHTVKRHAAARSRFPARPAT